jgi:serine/threonine protein kinase
MYGKAKLKSAEARAQVIHEVEVMKRLLLGAPNVCRLWDAFEDHRGIWVVTDFCRGGTLLGLLRSFRAEAARSMARAGGHSEGCSREDEVALRGGIPLPLLKAVALDLARAVRGIHRAGICHRDIKLENVLLDSPAPGGTLGSAAERLTSSTLRLGDFNLATSVMTESEALQDAVLAWRGAGSYWRGVDECSHGMERLCSGRCGSLLYMAPEALLLGVPYCGRAADVWSLGVCLYLLVTGRFPFRGGSEADVYRKIRTQSPPHQLDGLDSSHPLGDLVLRLLERNPARRPTAEAVCAHPWLRSSGEPEAATPPHPTAERRPHPSPWCVVPKRRKAQSFDGKPSMAEARGPKKAQSFDGKPSMAEARGPKKAQSFDGKPSMAEARGPKKAQSFDGKPSMAEARGPKRRNTVVSHPVTSRTVSRGDASISGPVARRKAASTRPRDEEHPPGGGPPLSERERMQQALFTYRNHARRLLRQSDKPGRARE